MVLISLFIIGSQYGAMKTFSNEMDNQDFQCI